MDRMVPVMYTSGEEVRAKWACVRKNVWLVLWALIWSQAIQIAACGGWGRLLPNTSWMDHDRPRRYDAFVTGWYRILKAKEY